jgi:lysozyme
MPVKKPAVKKPAAKRELFKDTHPNQKDAQVKAWKQNMVTLFKKMGIKPPIEVNSLYNRNTHNVSMALARAVGLDPKKVFVDGLGPKERDQIKKAAAQKPSVATQSYRKTLKKRWDAPKVDTSTTGTLNGIDVSSAQPSTIGGAVPGQFCITKATEGTTYVNPSFTNQMSSAKHSGKLVGLYHFADGRATPQQEAQHFYNTVRPYLGQAIMVLDWEGPALAEGPSWALAFMDEFYKLSGVKPLIYGSEGNICLSSYAAVAAKYPELWVAAYPSMNPTGYNPTVPFVSVAPWKTTRIRQYSSSGRLSGYGGNLDLDVFYGNSDLWRQLAAKS